MRFRFIPRKELGKMDRPVDMIRRNLRRTDECRTQQKAIKQDAIFKGSLEVKRKVAAGARDAANAHANASWVLLGYGLDSSHPNHRGGCNAHAVGSLTSWVFRFFLARNHHRYQPATRRGQFDMLKQRQDIQAVLKTKPPLYNTISNQWLIMANDMLIKLINICL